MHFLLNRKIRISAPINAGSQFLRSIFYDFLLQYPDVQLDLRFSNSLIDIEAEAIDVAFQVGHPAVENWIARPVKNIHFILCSHLDYDISDISTPDKLYGHPAIICNPITPWQLVHKESGEEFDYHPQKSVKLEVDEMLMLTHAIKKGLGIGYVPDYLAMPMITQGEMNHVLPDWRSKARTLFMLYRDRDHLPMRVRLLIDFVIANIDVI
ncbi:hypothetical protein CSW98_12325 [Vibrio sp. HA2012]|uniref:substrate binding domain-containing protein n=1 Tax=Vibrio sp. HA2012 TaxID=1971595 RepID=UPI000C2BD6BB|nr:substrate binding domain-containing protein [Vibrio sp. HA2012]PJC85838.1 hypothetical protein CSW98_12325 [Vibrio sp. HA2012]